MRYLFMAEHMPEQLRELKKQGMPALDAYMDGVQEDYNRTVSRYLQNWFRTHEHLKESGDWEAWLNGQNMAELMADEIAVREVVEAL